MASRPTKRRRRDEVATAAADGSHAEDSTFAAAGGDEGARTAICTVLHDKSHLAVAMYWASSDRIVLFSHACPDVDLPVLIAALHQHLAAAASATLIVSATAGEALRTEMQRLAATGPRATSPSASEEAPVESPSPNAGEGSRTGSGLGSDSSGAVAVMVKTVKAAVFALPHAQRLVAALRLPEWMDGIGSTSRPGTAVRPTTAASSGRPLTALSAASGVSGGVTALVPHTPVSRISGAFDTSDTVLVRAVGGLLHWLLQQQVMAEGMDESGAPTLILTGGIALASLADFMVLDAATIASLSILTTATHPCMVVSTAHGKEGYSICALLDRTVSSPGRQLLRTWCQQPSLDVELLRHRHDAVTFLVTAINVAPEATQQLRTLIKRCKAMDHLLLRLKRVRTGPHDWFALQQTVVAFTSVKAAVAALLPSVAPLVVQSDAAKASSAASRPTTTSSAASAATPASTSPYHEGSPFLLRQLLTECTADLTLLQATMDHVIDWDASRSDGRLQPQSGLDATLDEFRRAYANLPAFLGQQALEELALHPALGSLALHYVPQIGCLVVLDKASNGLKRQEDGGGGTSADVSVASTDAEWHARIAAAVPADFTLALETSTDVCFKNTTTAQLDQYFGDILATIHDLEMSIVRQLEERLLEFEPLLLTVAMRVAELDVLLAFAAVARDYGYTRPQLVGEPVTLVKGGRHPLQELSSQSFVPNDIAMQPGSSRAGAVAIITGPNGSGKSVYLKMVGVLSYMAQIGSFVPAQRACLGVVDRMFTRIQSLETAVVNASSFLIDLSQVALALRHCSPRSLLLFDEFGKGTSSADGAALLAATVRHLTVVTTHFREVLSASMLLGEAAATAPRDVAFFHMDVVLGESAADGSAPHLPAPRDWDRDVTPMFSLKMGVAASSYGLACARRAGIAEAVIRRAAEVTALLRANAAILPTEAFATRPRRLAGEVALLALLRHLTGTDWSAAPTAAAVDPRAAMLLHLLNECQQM